MVTLSIEREKPELEPSEYEEQIIKYTLNLPMIIWSEHPLRASPFYMKRKMLLDNCDKDTLSLVLCIMDK